MYGVLSAAQKLYASHGTVPVLPHSPYPMTPYTIRKHHTAPMAVITQYAAVQNPG